MEILATNTNAKTGHFKFKKMNPSEVELTKSLLERQARISPKYLYNNLGSKIFEAICELPEYYPTRTESLIIENFHAEIARTVARNPTLIDLGAGNCKKASRLFPILSPKQYVPVDISGEFLKDAVDSLRLKFPDIPMQPLEVDFSQSISFPPTVAEKRRLFFYPGSSIGNFSPVEAVQFLRQIHNSCGTDGGLLIGVDLIKAQNVLEDAYNDNLGITAAFNLNILLHLNTLIGSNFDLSDWQHLSFFNEKQNRIEIHLKARRAVVVNWHGGKREFEHGETIHTENSYKYTKDGFLELLRTAGFQRFDCWMDPNDWFMVCHAKATGPREWN